MTFARRALGALVACSLSALAGALPADREQPIEIAADRALRDELRGFTVYSGEVKLTQGSLVIEADKLTIFHRADEGQRIIAEGAPARMRQRPALDKPMMHAAASSIIYLRAEERIQLRRSASVEQDGAVVRGELIDYLIPQQLVRADAAKGDESGRVQVVIPAQKLPAQDTGEAPPAGIGPQRAEPPAAEESNGAAESQ